MRKTYGMLSEVEFTLKCSLTSQNTDAFLTTICLHNASHCSKLKKLWVTVGQLAGRSRIGIGIRSFCLICFFMVMNILAWQQSFSNHTAILLARYAKSFVHLSQSERFILLRNISDQSKVPTITPGLLFDVIQLKAYHVFTFVLSSWLLSVLSLLGYHEKLE